MKALFLCGDGAAAAPQSCIAPRPKCACCESHKVPGSVFLRRLLEPGQSAQAQEVERMPEQLVHGVGVVAVQCEFGRRFYRVANKHLAAAAVKRARAMPVHRHARTDCYSG